MLRNEQDQVVNVYRLGEIDAATFSKKNTELSDRINAITTQVEAVDRRRDDPADLALNLSELSQSPAEKWLAADYAARRRILESTSWNVHSMV